MGNPIQIDDKKFLRKMKKYEEIVGKEVSQLVQNAGRLCAIECAKYTAPRGNDTDAKKNGEKSLTKDLKQIFTSVNPRWWKEIIGLNKRKTRNTALINEKTGQAWVTDKQQTISSLDAAAAWHKSNKNKGRTKRLILIDRAVVKQSIFKKLLRENLRKVGLSKAGWVVVAEQCKADVREPLKGFPSWVKRNTLKASGSVSEVKQDGFGFELRLTNKVSYSRETLNAQSESFAVNLAKKKMLSMMNRSIRYEKAKQAQLQP
jgi:hypothetical protein